MNSSTSISLNVNIGNTAQINGANPDFNSIYNTVANAFLHQNIPANFDKIKPPIFVSYASEDRPIIRRLILQLETAGYTVWFDQNDIKGGDDWKTAIRDGVQKCMAMVAVITPNTVAKVHSHSETNPSWIVYEHQTALNRFAPVIPVKIGNFLFSDVPEYFQERNLQLIDLTNITGDKFDHFGKLQSAIESILLKRGNWLVDQNRKPGRQFVGRQDELEKIVALLESARRENVPLTLFGMAGIGKTMIARELGIRLGTRYPGGVLIEERGQQPRPAKTVMRQWLRLVGVEDNFDFSPDDVRGYLDRAGQLLVILDDVWPEDNHELRLLLSSLPVHADVIITTRNHDYASLLGTHVFELKKLDKQDARTFIQQRLKYPLTDNQSETIWHILDGHCLAMELTLARFQHESEIENQIEKLEQQIKSGNLSDLADIANRIPGLSPERDQSLLVSLEATINALKQTEPKLVKYFSMLGAFAPTGHYDEIHALNVLKTDKNEDEQLASAEISRVLSILKSYALLEEIEVEYGTEHPANPKRHILRLRQHIVVRSYALMLLKQNPELWKSAHENQVRFCLYMAHSSDEPGQMPIDLEIEQFDLSFHWAIKHNRRLAYLLNEFTWQQLLYFRLTEVAEDWFKAILNVVEDDIETSHELVSAAHNIALKGLGDLCFEKEALEKALTYYEKALAVALITENRVAEANTRRAIGNLFMRSRNYELALQHFMKTRNLYKSMGEKGKLGYANVLTQLGEIAAQNKDIDTAASYFVASSEIFLELGLFNHASGVQTLLGDLAVQLGAYEQAIEHYSLSLETAIIFDNIKQALVNNISLANVYLLTSNYTLAHQYIQQAEPLLEKVSTPANYIIFNIVKSGYLVSCGNYNSALKLAWQSHVLSRQVEDHFDQTITYTPIIRIAQDLGEEFRSLWDDTIDEPIPDWVGYDKELAERPRLLNRRAMLELSPEEWVQYENENYEPLEQFLVDARQSTGTAHGEVSEHFHRFLRLETLDKKESYIQIYPQFLLTDYLQNVLTEIIHTLQTYGHSEVAQDYENHRVLLQMCRNLGIQEAFQQVRGNNLTYSNEEIAETLVRLAREYSNADIHAMLSGNSRKLNQQILGVLAVLVHEAIKQANKPLAEKLISMKEIIQSLM